MILLSMLVAALFGCMAAVLLFTFPSVLMVLIGLVVIRAVVRRHRHRSDAFVEAMLR